MILAFIFISQEDDLMFRISVMLFETHIYTYSQTVQWNSMLRFAKDTVVQRIKEGRSAVRRGKEKDSQVKYNARTT